LDDEHVSKSKFYKRKREPKKNEHNGKRMKDFVTSTGFNALPDCNRNPSIRRNTYALPVVYQQNKQRLHFIRTKTSSVYGVEAFINVCREAKHVARR